MDTEIAAKTYSGGYNLEIAIPWSEIGGFPGDSSIGFNVALQSREEDSGTIVKESLSGNEIHKPSTWSKIQLEQ